MQLNESDRLEKSVVKPLMTVVGKVRDASGTLRSATGGMVGGLLTPILTAMLLTIGGTQRATLVSGLTDHQGKQPVSESYRNDGPLHRYRA
jgi:hypothetical protein